MTEKIISITRAPATAVKYLGDGAYIQTNGYDVELFTQRELGIDQVFLGTYEIAQMLEFVLEQDVLPAETAEAIVKKHIARKEGESE